MSPESHYSRRETSSRVLFIAAGAPIRAANALPVRMHQMKRILIGGCFAAGRLRDSADRDRRAQSQLQRKRNGHREPVLVGYRERSALSETHGGSNSLWFAAI